MVSKPTLLLALIAQALAGPGDDPADDPSTRRGPGPAAATAVHDGSAMELDVNHPWAESADIRIDGRVGDAGWEKAALLRGFTQFEPVEGVAASQDTEVRVLVTADAVYFSVVAFEDGPGGIRATLAQRDGYGRSDDWVRIVLDTFDDRRRAFVFQVNPLGVQADGLWVEGRGRGGPVDWNPDFLWESSGRVLDDRWVAELKIPLKSLRFPDAPVQDWGLQVIRRIQRNGYEASWAPLNRGRANQLEQAGRIRGLRGLDPGLFLELNPVVTGSRVGEWDDDVDGFRRGAPTSDVGFNLTYGLTSNLTLDGTYNPDFSQVEADAGQITVNERFAIRLPEKRPFFLEGADVFSMPAQLVYTRSIANPVGAAKLSGKAGGTSVAYLGAVDEVGTGAGRDRPLINLFRLKRDIGTSSTVGMVYTDRTQPGQSFNRVAGADGRLVLGGRYTLDLLAAASADGGSERDTEWGSMVVARFDRSGRRLSLSGSFEDVTDDFRARSGFIRRVGVTEAEVRTGWTWRGSPGALVERWGPSLELEGSWDREDFWQGGGPEESSAQLSLSGSFRGNVGGYLSWSRSRFAVAPDEYEGLFVVGPDGVTTPFRPSGSLFEGLDAIRLRSWMSSWERVRVSVGGSWSETPVFDRRLGLPADVGESLGADVDLTLYLTGALSADVGARHSTITRKRDGSTYSTATIPRIRARYQLSRSLFVRGTAEYALQERGPVLDPRTGGAIAACDAAGCAPQSGSDRYDVSFDGLVGYEPSPGTVFFLGYSRRMSDSLGFRFRDVTTREDGLFVKLSWRFRM